MCDNAQSGRKADEGVGSFGVYLGGDGGLLGVAGGTAGVDASLGCCEVSHFREGMYEAAPASPK